MRLLTIYLESVELRGNEYGVTMIVGGQLVSGVLTPLRRFEEWQERSFAISELHGGRVSFELESIAPLTPEESAAIAAEHADTPSTPDEPFEFGCLRDARIHGGDGSAMSVPFLVFRADDVSALSPSVPM